MTSSCTAQRKLCPVRRSSFPPSPPSAPSAPSVPLGCLLPTATTPTCVLPRTPAHPPPLPPLSPPSRTFLSSPHSPQHLFPLSHRPCLTSRRCFRLTPSPRPPRPRPQFPPAGHQDRRRSLPRRPAREVPQRRNLASVSPTAAITVSPAVPRRLCTSRVNVASL